MTNDQRIAALSALAHPARLAALAEIAQAGESGMRAGEIAVAIGTPQNTMSAHLAVLARAGLVTSVKVGKTNIYCSVKATVRELTEYLGVLGGDG